MSTYGACRPYLARFSSTGLPRLRRCNASTDSFKIRYFNDSGQVTLPKSLRQPHEANGSLTNPKKFSKHVTSKENMRPFEHPLYSQQEHEDLEKGCSTKLARFSFAELQHSKKPVKLSTESELICSYNCDSNNTLYVPGAPPRWTPPGSLPVQIPQPKKVNFYVRSSGEAIWPHVWRSFEAIPIMRPSYKFAKVDVVCSAKSLAALLESCFSGGPFYGYTTRLVDQTLFIDMIEPQSYSTERRWGKRYINEVQETVTTPEDALLQSSRHYRWHQYQLGDLRCAVLVEVDTYIGNPDECLSPSPLPTPVSQPAVHIAGGSVIQVGRSFPQEDLATLECIRVKKVKTPSTLLPEINFSRISTHFQAECEIKGINDVEIRQVREDNLSDFLERKWNRRWALTKLAALLKKLNYITAQSTRKACIALTHAYEDSGHMHIYEPEYDSKVLDQRKTFARFRVPPTSLPEAVVEKFWKSEKQEESTS